MGKKQTASKATLSVISRKSKCLCLIASYAPALCHVQCTLCLRPFPFQSVTLHTDLGDIKLELHCNLVPKTCEVSSLLSSSSGSWVARATPFTVR